MIEENETILVTAIGTVAGSAIVQELRKCTKGKIIGTDINESLSIVTSGDVDEFFVFPSVIDTSEEDYYHFIKEFCIIHKIQYIYSIIDEEVILLRTHEDDLYSAGVQLCLANRPVIETCHYKDRFSEWVEANIPEIAIPVFSKENISSANFPLFVKPVEGRASNGCRVVWSKEELAILLSENQLDNCIIQEYIEGRIIAVDIVRDAKNGVINVVQRAELLRNASGSGVAVEIVLDPLLEEISINLAIKLDLNGVVNAEFFCNDKGYKIIEINPRFPAGTSFSCLAGVNIVKDALLIAKGQPIPSETPQVGRRFARRYETYCMN